MMIEITVADDYDGIIAELYTRMNPLVAQAELLWHSSTRAVFETATHERYVIIGTGLEWSSANEGGSPSLLGGAIESMTWRKGAKDLVTFADLQTTGKVLWAAFEDEMSGRDPQAVTSLLAKHCWTYRGGAGNDIFPEAAVAGFGVPDLTGTDRIWLNGGDDVFFTGSANDTIFGGEGNDQLRGGDDDDDLIGGAGFDSLFGGDGTDVLSGNSGSDLLSGGLGHDTLTGGAQGDVFVFRRGAGVDVITDFQDGVDWLQIEGVRRIEVVAQGADTEIHYGRNIVLLLGISADDITGADFL